MRRLPGLLDSYRKLRTFLSEDYDALKGLLDNNYQTHEVFQRREFFRRAFNALSFNEIDGDYVEFGTGNTSFPLAHKESRRANYACHLWAFDSFKGLPKPQVPEDSHPKWIEGSLRTTLEQFKQMCRENGIPEQDYDIVPGFFEDTIGAKKTGLQLPTNISLAYFDCDLYSSTKVALDFLASRLKHGMIVAFDDYYCWSKNEVSGTRRASAEFFSRNEEFGLLPYHQYGWGGMSFNIEKKALTQSWRPSHQ